MQRPVKAADCCFPAGHRPQEVPVPFFNAHRGHRHLRWDGCSLTHLSPGKAKAGGSAEQLRRSDTLRGRGWADRDTQGLEQNAEHDHWFLPRLQPLLVFVWIMLWRIQNLITANFFLPHDIIYASLSLPTNTHNHHACFRAQGFSVWKHTKLLSRGGRSASSPCTPFWGSCFSLGPLPSIRAPGTQVLWVHFVRKKQKLSEKTQSTFPPPRSTVRNRWTLKVTTGHKYFFNLINYLTQIYTAK